MTRSFVYTAILSAVILAGCGGKEEAGNGVQTIDKNAAIQARKVTTEPIALRTFHRSFVATGSLTPKETARFRSLQDGQLTEVPVEIGMQVKEGDLLFQVRPTEMELAVESARAAMLTAKADLADFQAWRRPEEVETLRAQLDESRAAADHMTSERARFEALVEQGSASASEFEGIRSSAIAAESRLTAAEQQLRIAEQGPTPEAVAVREARLAQAEAALASAEQHLNDTSVKAMFDGTVTMRAMKRGDYARKGDEVVEVSDLSVLQAEMNIPERFAGALTKGATVELEVSGVNRTGTIIAVNPAIDQRTRTFLVKVEVENSDLAIKAGTFAVGRFSLNAVEDAPAVPVAAVMEEEGRSFIWVAEEGQARRLYVQTGERSEGLVEVRPILNESVQEKEVIVHGQGALAEGDQLEASRS